MIKLKSSPLLLHEVGHLHHFELDFTPSVVVQDALIRLSVRCLVMSSPQIFRPFLRWPAQIELIGLHIATGTGSSRREDTNAVVHGGYKSVSDYENTVYCTSLLSGTLPGSHSDVAAAPTRSNHFLNMC